MAEEMQTLLRELRAFALSFPGSASKSPWPGHDDVAVRDKTFVYLSAQGEPFKVSCKLPYTADAALELPFASPTAYGLGRSNWVTFMPTPDQVPSLEQFKDWVDESYRAQAPRKLVKELDTLPPGHLGK